MRLLLFAALLTPLPYPRMVEFVIRGRLGLVLKSWVVAMESEAPFTVTQVPTVWAGKVIVPRVVADPQGTERFEVLAWDPVGDEPTGLLVCQALREDPLVIHLGGGGCEVGLRYTTLEIRSP